MSRRLVALASLVVLLLGGAMVRPAFAACAAGYAHAFSSGKADGADTTVVRPSDWNDCHKLIGGNNGELVMVDTTDATYRDGFTTNLTYLSSQLRFPDGNAAAPSIVRSGDVTTGLYFAATQVSVATGGTERLRITNSGIGLTSNLIAVTDATYDIGAAGATRPRDFFLSRNATVGGVLVVTGTAGNVVGGATNTDVDLLITGTISPAAIGYGLRVTSTINAVAANNAYGVSIEPTLVEAGSGNHTLLAGLNLGIPTVTAGAATVTNAATLHIAGPTAAVVSGANYAVLIDSGVSSFGGIAQPGSDNAIDLGTSSLEWRTGYFGTSLVAPLLTFAGVVTVQTTAASNLVLDVGSNTIVYGPDVGTPVARNLHAADATGTDIVGSDLVLAAGRGTGTGAGGVLTFQTAAAGGASGASKNALATAMTITSAGNVGIATASPTAKLQIGGTPGVDGIKFPDGTLMTSASVGSASNLSNASDAIVNADSDSSGAGDVRLQTQGTDKLRIVVGGAVGIGTSAPATSALLDLTSTTGALLLPRMTTTQRDALTATAGMVLYNSTTGQLEGREGTVWNAIGQTRLGGRLDKSGANLRFCPYNGNHVIVNSQIIAIPDACITLAVGATLTEGGTPGASATFYIYVYNNSGTLTLQASATTHATQAGTGIEIRSADATRTLVGMARTTAGTAWADSATQIFVLSWFNRRTKTGRNNYTADRTTTSTTFAELNTEIRVEFLTWSDEDVLFGAMGSMNVGAAGASSAVAIGIDGTTKEVSSAGYSQAASADTTLSVAGQKSGASEGYHYATVLGRSGNAANTTTFRGVDATNLAEQTKLWVGVRG